MPEEKILPKDWKWVKLGEVCHTTSGGTPSRRESKYYMGDIPWVKSGELDKGIIVDTEERISEEAVRNSSAKIFPKGTLLIALYGDRATIGKLAFLGIDAATNQAVCGIYKSKEIDLNYLHNYLLYKRQKLINQGIGGAQPNISQTILRDLDLPLPSKPIQISMVSKMKELFSELDKAIGQLNTVHHQLKIYRHSVLNTLATGENFRTLESVIEKLEQGWSPKCDKEASVDSKEWAVIKTSAVQSGYFLEFENKRLPKVLKPRKQHELKAGDILITRAGPRVRVGICCLVKTVRPNLINCDKVYRIKLNTKTVMPEYLEFILNTPKYQDEIEKMKSGISDSGLNLTQKAFLMIKIPVPTLENQNTLVFGIENRLSMAKKMEGRIVKCFQQAEVLKQSIFKKAFEGKLI